MGKCKSLFDNPTTNAGHSCNSLQEFFLRLLKKKQDKLVSGENIKTINGIPVIGEGDLRIGGAEVLIPGENITINNGVISATDTIYDDSEVRQDIQNLQEGKQNKLTAGQGITIDEQGVISSEGTQYEAGENVTIENNRISAVDTKYTAGVGLSLNGTEFSSDCNHTVISRIKIIEDEQGAELYKSIIQCDLNGQSVSAMSFKDFKVTEYSHPRTYLFSRLLASSSVEYAGIFGTSSTSGLGLFKIDITHLVSGKQETHYVGLIEDTPSDATFLFITTCTWNMKCTYKSTSMYCYLEVPADFRGTIKVTPIGKKVRVGDNYFTFEPDGSGITSYSWNNTEAPDDVVPVDMFSTPYGSEFSPSGIREPYGRYNVDILYDLGNLNIGDKVSDMVVNDCLLHDLSKKLEGAMDVDLVPTLGSSKIVISNGIYDAIRNQSHTRAIFADGTDDLYIGNVDSDTGYVTSQVTIPASSAGEDATIMIKLATAQGDMKGIILTGADLVKLRTLLDS